MVATLSTAGTSWSEADERGYDVWGSVRSGATTGGPKGRYVANLGHVQDDESGLIYMRARYYEPETGRFVSEDNATDGDNWYVYANSNPITFVDIDGNEALETILVTLVGKYLVDKILGEIQDYGVRSVGRLLIALSNLLLSSGRNDIAEASAIFTLSRASGSFGTAIAGGSHALRLGIGGASKVAAGLMLRYIGMAVMWIDDLDVEKVIGWFK